MSEHKEGLVSQDFYNTEVRTDALKPWYSIAAVLIGYCISFGIPLVGAAMGTQVGSVSEGMTALLIGCLIMGSVGSVSAVIAVRTRLSFGLIIRQAFGKHGQWLFGFVIALLALCFWIFGGNLCAETLKAVFGVSFYLAFPVIGVVFVITAFIGYRALQFLSYFIVPIILLGMIVSTFNSIGSVGGLAGMDAIHPKSTIPFATLVTLATSSFYLGFATYVLDVLRFARTVKDGIIGVWCGVIGIIIATLMGFFVARAEGTGVLGVALVGKYLGGSLAIGALLVIFITWSTLDNTMYSSSLTFSSVFNVPKTRMIIILGIFGIILGMGRVLAQFTAFITGIGLYAPALAGAIWVEYFVFSKAQWDNIENLSKREVQGIDLNYNAVIAIIAAGFAANLAKTSNFLIPPPIVNLVASIIFYYTLGKITGIFIKNKAEA